MKTNIKKIGWTADGRELYEVEIRKNHAAEDYAEMVKIQRESYGKRRFKIVLLGFSNKESETFVKTTMIHTLFLNVIEKNDHYVSWSDATLYIA